MPRLIFAIALVFALFQCPIGTAPVFTSSSTAVFTEGVSTTFAVTASGSPAPTFSESGALPQGVSFTATGLQGSPALGTAGTYNLTFSASNGVLPNASQAVVLKVNPAAVVGGLWTPPLVTSWQWQLSTFPLSPSGSSLLNVGMYDVDGFDSPASLVAAMHSKGIHAVCYLSVGTSENFRSDYAQFPASVKGKSNGWPGEKWLDIRQISVLAPIMTARFQMCKDKGFDAVEPDNQDGYTNSTGFPLTSSDQLTYNKWIASTVHSLGLSVALKNDGDQVGQLLSYYDFSIAEQCQQYGECGLYKPFVSAGKAVFAAEYRTGGCPALNALNFNGAIFDLDLTGKRTPCR